jgi:hypothetical protein
VRQLIILNLRYLERSMHYIKYKVDVIMFQVSKFKKVENWRCASQGVLVAPRPAVRSIKLTLKRELS